MINGRLYDFSKRVDEVISQIRAHYIEEALFRGETEQHLLEKDSLLMIRSAFVAVARLRGWRLVLSPAMTERICV